MIETEFYTLINTEVTHEMNCVFAIHHSVLQHAKRNFSMHMTE